MTGQAKAMFRCGATNLGPCTFCNEDDCEFIGRQCDKGITVDLVNDGWYTMFNQPEGWHIELGVFDPTKTIVRCPQHCAWIDISAQYKGQGQWQDTP